MTDFLVLTDAQKLALTVLTKGYPVRVSNVTDFDEETVHERAVTALRHAGYAAWADEAHVMVEITEDGHTAAKRLGLE